MICSTSGNFLAAEERGRLPPDVYSLYLPDYIEESDNIHFIGFDIYPDMYCFMAYLFWGAILRSFQLVLFIVILLLNFLSYYSDVKKLV